MASPTALQLISIPLPVECFRNKLFSATDFKEIITSGPAPCAEDITVIKPLGDATAKLMVNVEPNRSSIDVYDDLFKAS